MSHSRSAGDATVGGYYDSRAELYQQQWSDALAPANRLLLDRLPLATAAHVLDLGSGVGSLLPVISRSAPAARVVAADRSIGMLRLAPSSFPRVIVDAQALPFRSGTFDLVVLAFMIQHLPNPLLAFTEVKRVLRAGGRIGIAMWGRQHVPEALAIWQAELDRLGAPEASSLVQQTPEVDSEQAITDVLSRAGFESIRSRSIPWVDHRDVETFTARHLALGAASRRFAQLAPDAQHEFLRRIRDRLRELPPGAFHDESEVLGVVAGA